MTSFADPVAALSVVAAIAGAGIFLSTLRHVAQGTSYATDGAYPWRLPAERTHTRAERVAAAVFDHPGFTMLLAARSGSGLWLAIAALTGASLALPATLLLATSLLKIWRLRLINEEAEVMNTAVLFPLALHAWSPGDLHIAAAGLWFICAQVCLAYMGAAAAKLRSPIWRRGEALASITGESLLRHPRLAGYLSRGPLPGRLLSWGAIAFQLSFPLAVVLPESVLPVFLAAGIIFHAAIAVTLGLGSFLWAFLAGYPAVAFTASTVSKAIWN